MVARIVVEMRVTKTNSIVRCEIVTLHTRSSALLRLTPHAIDQPTEQRLVIDEAFKPPEKQQQKNVEKREEVEKNVTHTHTHTYTKSIDDDDDDDDVDQFAHVYVCRQRIQFTNGRIGTQRCFFFYSFDSLRRRLLLFFASAISLFVICSVVRRRT